MAEDRQGRAALIVGAVGFVVIIAAALLLIPSPSKPPDAGYCGKGKTFMGIVAVERPNLPANAPRIGGTDLDAARFCIHGIAGISRAAVAARSATVPATVFVINFYRGADRSDLRWVASRLRRTGSYRGVRIVTGSRVLRTNPFGGPAQADFARIQHYLDTLKTAGSSASP